MENGTEARKERIVVFALFSSHSLSLSPGGERERERERERESGRRGGWGRGGGFLSLSLSLSPPQSLLLQSQNLKKERRIEAEEGPSWERPLLVHSRYRFVLLLLLPADGSSLPPLAPSFPALASFDVSTKYPQPPSVVRSVKMQVPPTGTFETSGEGPPPEGAGVICEHSEESGAGAAVVAVAADDGDVEVFVASDAAAALSPLTTSVTEKVCGCCSLLLLLLLPLLPLLPILELPAPPPTTHVNVGAPSTTARVPAGLAPRSAEPPSMATASERRRPSEATAGGGGPGAAGERMGPIRAASGSFSAEGAACGVGVSVKANVVALGGPEAT